MTFLAMLLRSRSSMVKVIGKQAEREAFVWWPRRWSALTLVRPTGEEEGLLV